MTVFYPRNRSATMGIIVWSLFGQREISAQLRSLRKRGLIKWKNVYPGDTGDKWSPNARRQALKIWLTEDGWKELNDGSDAESPGENAAQACVLRYPDP